MSQIKRPTAYAREHVNTLTSKVVAAPVTKIVSAPQPSRRAIMKSLRKLAKGGSEAGHYRVGDNVREQPLSVPSDTKSKCFFYYGRDRAASVQLCESESVDSIPDYIKWID
ncbi:hypothetical protein EVAR_66729_1 [Eumeta japonica]|uniref:Uncharacterized protein n=1 Tax=Eumeta variegata TaxID=151549 RepID=A0A4C1ZZJ7_EUMVA|nr:hypothetical protein EVAR_66729_1 [Eumeta japonica]